MAKKLVKQEGQAGAIGAARDMVAQLQTQAQNGQIDGAMLDQLEAILNVSVDTAKDEQPKLKAEADAAPDVPEVEAPAPAPDAETPEKTPDEFGKVDEALPEEEETLPEEEEKTKPEQEEPTMEKDIVSKVEPATARPPRVNLQFDKVDDLNSRLPEFIKNMETGQVAKAQKVAGNDTRDFDTMFSMAQHALLEEGGWRSNNLTKLSTMAIDNASDALNKSITASSVPGIYLIRLAKLMLPVYAGLTNRIPTDSPKGMGSTTATWRAQLGFGSLAEASFFRVPEASIGVNPPTSFLTFDAPFNDLAVNDSVTLKALRASAGYSDPLQIGVIKAMSALLRGQERVLLGSNHTAISAPAAATVGASGAPAATVFAAGSYVVGISALTYEGWLSQSKGGSAAVGETVATFGAQFVLGAGSSLNLTWAAVPGAVAYNVYVSGSSGHFSGSTSKWNQMVNINKATVSALSAGANVSPTADTTANETYGIEGLLQWCSGSVIYGNTIPDKQAITDNAGAGLTAGNGGITQFDGILANLWTKWHTAPSVMVMSPNLNATLVGKLQGLGSGNFYRIEVGQERNTVNGGMMVTGYVNKFAPFADGTPRMIDVIPHPYMPEGSVMFLSETIPYPMGNESRGFVRDVLLPYTYFPLPSQAAGVNQTTYNFAVTTSETLECFNPGPQAMLQGVDYSA